MIKKEKGDLICLLGCRFSNPKKLRTTQSKIKPFMIEKLDFNRRVGYNNRGYETRTNE